MNLIVGEWLKSYELNDLKECKLQFTGMAWDEYDDDPKVDVLILGSSHAFRSYDPDVLDQYFPNQKRSFNLGSPAQSLITSYHVLEEVLRRSKPEVVVLDLYFMVCTSDDQLKNGRLVWQSMSGLDRTPAFFRGSFSLSEQLLLMVFPSYVYRHRIKPKIKALLGLPHLPATEGFYKGRGFATWNDTIGIEEIENDNQFDYFTIDTSDLTTKNLFYLEQIIDLCHVSKIPLVLSVAPMPSITVSKVETYADFYDYFSILAKEHNVPYLDYNQERLPSIEDGHHFHNDDHLNASGAEIFSHHFGAELTKVIEDWQRR